MNDPQISHNPGTLLQPVCQIAEHAAHEILRIYETDFNIEHKDDRSPLTAADMAAHRTIVAGLKQLVPDIPILSEESATTDFETRCRWSLYWLVDPLDGTREFIKRNGEFTVNIALIDNGKPVIGVVHVPVTGVCYYASQAAGSYKVVPGNQPQKIRTRKVELDNIAVAGSRSHGSEAFKMFLDNIGTATDIVTIGSSLKSCLIAEGAVDIYPRFGPTSEWDTAAAQCVVEEAGGLVTDMQLQPLRYNTKDSLINPGFLVIGDPAFDWRQYLPKQ